MADEFPAPLALAGLACDAASAHHAVPGLEDEGEG